MPEEDTEGEDIAGDHVASLRAHLVAAAGGEADLAYPLAAIAVPRAGGEVSLVAAVLVGISSSDEIIFVAPGSVWHRTAARRVLPRNFVRKLAAGRVRLVRPEDRGSPLEGDCRVWFGLLTEDGEAATDFVRDLEDPVELAHNFGPEEASDSLPFGPSVLEASHSLFEFLTAESAGPVEAEAVGAGAGDPFGDRLSNLEACFAELRQDLRQVLGAVGGAKAKQRGSTSAAPSGGRAPSQKVNRAEEMKFAGLDPAVTKAALEAGIETSHLEEMSKLLRKQGGRLTDVPGAAARKAAKPKTKNDLDDEDSFPDTVPDDEPAAGSPLNPIEAAVSKLTEIAGRLASQKRKDSSLDALLDLGASGSGEASVLEAGRLLGMLLLFVRFGIEFTPSRRS